MLRKALTTGLAAALAVVVLPALPAMASHTTTAQLTSSKNVFPGGRTFTLQITNTGSTTGGLTDSTVDAIRVELPTAAAGVTHGAAPASCSGWTATKTSVGGTAMVDFRGGTLAPGSSLTCTIPTEVLRPTRNDLSGSFRVLTSSNGFETNTAATPTSAGALTASVRILEIVGGRTTPVAPTNAEGTRGVTDRSGTEGQTVTYAFDVKNHAREAVTVTPTITPTGLLDTGGTGSSVRIEPEATATLDAPLALGAVTSGLSRSVTVTAGATATGATGIGPSGPVTDTFTVQRKVLFSYGNLRPRRTKSGDFSRRDFLLDVTKTGAQGAVLDTSRLTFGSNAGDADGLPLSLGGGTVTRTVTYVFSGIVGGDADHDAVLSSTGTDDNLASLVADPVNLGLITIDNVKPLISQVVSLGNDQDGDARVAATNGHPIAVSGVLSGQSLTGTVGTNDLDLTTLRVRLVPDAGAERTVTVTTTRNTDGTVFYSGSHTVGQTGTATAWDAAATAVTATTEVCDQARNCTLVASSAQPVDLRTPVLTDPGTILDPRTIEIQFFDASSIRGGCDAGSYSLSGIVVGIEKVTFPDGTPCDPRRLTDGRRYIVLSEDAALDRTATPTLTYTPRQRTLGVIPAKDGSGQDVPRTEIQLTNLIEPLMPQLVRVERRNLNGTGTEAAYLDTTENAYYTNAAGDDENTVTVSGVRHGYSIEVRDGHGRFLKRVGPFTVAPDLLGRPQSTSGTVELPLGDVQADGTRPVLDGTHARQVLFVSSTGVPGVPLKLDLVLDRVLPTLAGPSVWDGSRTATQRFAEKIVAGSNGSSNWYVAYEVNGDGGPQTAYTTSNSVAVVDQFTRAITVALDDPNSFRGVGYLASGARYEDRAGNLMLDTLSP